MKKNCEMKTNNNTVMVFSHGGRMSHCAPVPGHLETTQGAQWDKYPGASPHKKIDDTKPNWDFLSIDIKDLWFFGKKLWFKQQ